MSPSSSDSESGGERRRGGGGGAGEGELLRLAEGVAAHPLLLAAPPVGDDVTVATFYAKRRETLAWLANQLGLRITVAAMRKRIMHLRKLYFREVSRGGGGEAAPRWVQLVRPLLQPAAEPAPAAPTREERARRVLAALTERARARRTIAAADVCDPLPDHPGLAPAALQALWEGMLAVARSKLDYLISCGDSEAGLAADARLAPDEWRLLDAALLHEPRPAVLARDHTRQLEPLRALVACFHLVQLHQLEPAGAAAAGGGWRAALAAYLRRGRVASLVLLQRRWHELKEETRRRLAARARDAAGDPPCPLHAAIARRYPHVVTAPLPAWAELVAAGAVLEEGPPDAEEAAPGAEEFASRVTVVSPTFGAAADREEDDLILVEREIETVDLLAEADSPPAPAPRGSPPPERAALLERRQRVARALEEELDRQLRDLEDPMLAGAGGAAGPAQVGLAAAALPARVKPEPPEDGEDAPPCVIADVRSAAAVKAEPASDSEDGAPSLLSAVKSSIASDDDSRAESLKMEWESENEDEKSEEAGSDEKPAFDSKLLMSTSVPLMRVDAPGWRDLVPAPPAAPPPAKRRRSVESAARELLSTLLAAGVGGGEGEQRKRVTLPDIAEVRRSHQRMLTAQVAPLAAPDPAPSPPSPPSAPPSRSSSEESNLLIDESDGSLTAAQLEAVLRRLAAERGAAGAAARGGPRRAQCCPARYHREVDDARRRNALRAGRPPPGALALHAARCRPPCACCCRHLLDTEGAARRLRAARDRALAALHRADTAPSPPEPKPTDKAKKPGKSKRKERKDPEEDAAAAADPLEEWNRQKNITSRFFDLNLKRPVPAPRPPAPAPAPRVTAACAPVLRASSSAPFQVTAAPAPVAVRLAASPPAEGVPVAGSYVNLVASRAPAPAPAAARVSEVVDLCGEDEDEEPPEPAAPPAPPAGGSLLLNSYLQDAPPPPPALEAAPGRAGIKVFKISQPAAPSPNGPLAASSTRKKITKIVLVPRRPGGDKDAAAPPAAPSASKTRKLVLVPQRAAAGGEGAPPPPAAPPRLLNSLLPAADPAAAMQMSEVRTSDGMRVIVMRRSGTGGAERGRAAARAVAAGSLLRRRASPSRAVTLGGGAVVQPLAALFDPDARAWSLQQWLAAAGGSPGPALRVARGAAYVVRGQYYVAARLLRPSRNADYWSGGANPRRLYPRPSEHAHTACLNAPSVARAPAEVARWAHAGLELTLHHARSGGAHALVPVKPCRPGELALRCPQYLDAAAQITKDVNEFLLRARRVSQPPAPAPPPPPAAPHGFVKEGFVRIAPKPEPAAPSDSAGDVSPPPAPHDFVKEESVRIAPRPVPTSPPDAAGDESPHDFVKGFVRIAPRPATSPPADAAGDESPPAPSRPLFEIKVLPLPPVCDLTSPPASPPPGAPSPETPPPVTPPPAAPPTPRPSRSAARAARAKVNAMMMTQLAAGEGADYAEAAGADADSDDDYSAGAGDPRPRRGRWDPDMFV